MIFLKTWGKISLATLGLLVISLVAYFMLSSPFDPQFPMWVRLLIGFVDITFITTILAGPQKE